MSSEAGDLTSVRESFDGIAEAYATAFVDELEGKPFDRGLLDELVAGTRPGRTDARQITLYKSVGVAVQDAAAAALVLDAARRQGAGRDVAL